MNSLKVGAFLYFSSIGSDFLQLFRIFFPYKPRQVFFFEFSSANSLNDILMKNLSLQLQSHRFAIFCIMLNITCKQIKFYQKDVSQSQMKTDFYCSIDKTLHFCFQVSKLFEENHFENSSIYFQFLGTLNDFKQMYRVSHKKCYLVLEGCSTP